MCQLFVACALTCPSYKSLWHPTLLSCPLAREAARRSSRPAEIYPCSSVTTLWNEDLCPYCLTDKLSRGASKYVKECLVKWPLRYEPVFLSGRYLMRWVGRAREEFNIERRMDGKEKRRRSGCCDWGRECKCNQGGGRMINDEWLAKKARLRSCGRYYGKEEEGLLKRGKETYYECKPTERKESYYTCEPRALTKRYYTTASPCQTKVRLETEKERMKREKEEDRAYEKYNKSRRKSTTTTYQRNGYDIDADVDVDVDVDVKERRSSRKSGSGRKKSVSFADDKHYYG